MSTLRGFVPRLGMGRLAVLVLAAFAFVSCYDDYGLTYSDYDVIVTYYDKAAKFADLPTFFLPDTVYHPEEGITTKYDDQILSLVEGNLKGLGYTRVTDTLAARPTALITVTVAKTTTVYWSYWPGYYPGWGYGWGYYPGYYPPYMTGGAYQTGTIYVNFSDARNTASGTLKVVWLGIANGLAGASSTSTRITNGINQMFLQSPYLGIN